ncbi:dihydrofolate reductase family protein [Micromonospora andamanensis]|uniref:Deaminase n=1 Tax=Micromonospora andamanensis TaxID=1287068 RepID=A0ABQ4I2D9_9ACTN|nr:dihydrofolate reductase family protein [Micromonospora andamanensis]GIJ12079.1 deaminase [Micromonospora andamanensis]GIJ42941.1 deaminase [Micromonospora andamanensis]
MTKVIADMSMSIDGFIADAADGVDELFEWYGNGDVETATAHPNITFPTSVPSADRLRQALNDVGALVVGRRLFDLTNGWGGRHPMGVPVFVVTHRAAPDWLAPDAPFVFVHDGVEAAVAAARQAAGDRLVGVASASITQQCLRLGLLDELHVNLVPVLLGTGVRWFEKVPGPVWAHDPQILEGTRVTRLVFPLDRSR